MADDRSRLRGSERRKQDEQAFRETVVAETGFTEAGEIMVRIVRAVSNWILPSNTKIQIQNCPSQPTLELTEIAQGATSSFGRQ